MPGVAGVGCLLRGRFTGGGDRRARPGHFDQLRAKAGDLRLLALRRARRHEDPRCYADPAGVGGHRRPRVAGGVLDHRLDAAGEQVVEHDGYAPVLVGAGRQQVFQLGQEGDAAHAGGYQGSHAFAE